VERYAEKLQIADVWTGCHDKAGATREFAAKYGLDLSAVCFIGDDVPDLPAMAVAGLAVAPANAQPAALKAAHHVTAALGGAGVLREVIERVLTEQGIS
jgi:3-deoxy-D-manno-octulosonate 8-phosphate phosphatase (KDO 8-P phosphatase)